MALEKYKAKRSFDKTPEPEGKEQRSAGKLKFVVQKHHASHLHYDFRLELDGVLKSWAVPKGPSLDPAVKRLAMMVEDHPYSYMRFEGTIPEGNYGAGKVIVWDIGDYWAEQGGPSEENEKALRAGLKKGHLAIFLSGKKLKGLFDLVHMHGHEENAWLLVKREDEYASDRDLTKLDKSAISTRRLPDPAASKGRGRATAASKKATEITRVKLPEDEPKQAARRPRATRGKAAGAETKSADDAAGRAQASKATAIPYPIKPMLCTLVDKAFDGDDWVFEVKWDGYRALGHVDGGDVRLYSRNAKSFELQYPTVFAALPQLGHNCVLDGEVVALAKGGKSSFQALQNYGNTQTGTIRYAVFDLLFLDGYDLRGLLLLERKSLLQQLVKAAKSKEIVYSDHVAGRGMAFFESAKARGLEGMIAKRADSTYQSTRGSDWLKVKVHLRQEAVIAGFTQPRGSRTGFGALILGVYDGGRLRYIGHTGTGFTEADIEALHPRLLKLATPGCPFLQQPKTNMPAVWVKPRLLCEVEFTEWTGDGHMRHPVFIGLREDKPARSVKEEEVKPVEEVVGQQKTAGTRASARQKDPAPSPAKKTAGRSGLKSAVPEPIDTKATLTHPEKLYWPREGITKGEMLAYYASVADYILPYLKDRPLSLNRYPAGIEGHSFFQKDVDFKVPPFAKTVDIYSESNGEDITWLLAQNRDSLLYVANLGSIEINPWNSRVGKLDKPDYTVIDLDPDTNSFDEVVALALQVRKILDRLGIEGYPKTSGKTGIHIYIPLGAKYTYEQAKELTHIIVRLLHAQSPANTSLERLPAKRQGRVYLDYLQNRTGQTLAAPYSVRPAPGAPVSTPLKWTEVRKGLQPAKFTIFNTPPRLEKVGDLWAPVLGPGIDLAAILDRLSGAMAAKAQAA